MSHPAWLTMLPEYGAYAAFVLGAAFGGFLGTLWGRWSLLVLMRPRRRRLRFRR